jgi:fatty acid desaturase
VSGRKWVAVELPTVVVIGVFAALYVVIVLNHRVIPWPLLIVAFALLGGWHMSIQHELVHGHPTPWRALNLAVGFLPLSMWLPFVRYSDSHLEHHITDLTHPERDPESFYLMPDDWRGRGPIGRAYVLVLRTLAGRLTLGALRGIVRYLIAEAMTCTRNRRVLAIWSTHAVATAVLCWWLFLVVGVFAPVYLIGFSIGGYSLTLLRSYAEHCAVESGTQSAVINASPPMALLYLNNNLHHTHHERPGVAWYELPAVHRQMGSDEIAALGAGLYRGGYTEVARRNMFRPFERPDHPFM